MRMKIKFVQLESQAFFTYLDFITMSAAERGAYCTPLLHLCCNAGRREFDPLAVARLCNCDDFEKVWEKIAKKISDTQRFDEFACLNFDHRPEIRLWMEATYLFKPKKKQARNLELRMSRSKTLFDK